MTIDKKTLDMLLMLDDDKLAAMIKRLAANSGIDISNVNISPKDLNGLRSALSPATDKDIERAVELIKSYKEGKRNF